MITLGVREFDGSSDGRRRFCENRSEKSRSLPSEARRNSPSGSSQSPGVCRMSAVLGSRALRGGGELVQRIKTYKFENDSIKCKKISL